MPQVATWCRLAMTEQLKYGRNILLEINKVVNGYPIVVNGYLRVVNGYLIVVNGYLSVVNGYLREVVNGYPRVDNGYVSVVSCTLSICSETVNCYLWVIDKVVIV